MDLKIEEIRETKGELMTPNQVVTAEELRNMIRETKEGEVEEQVVYKKVLSEEDRARVIQLVRGVSVCWSNIDEAGTYDTAKADELTEDFCDYLVGITRIKKNEEGPLFWYTKKEEAWKMIIEIVKEAGEMGKRRCLQE